jgi:hypothetical protein
MRSEETKLAEVLSSLPVLVVVTRDPCIYSAVPDRVNTSCRRPVRALRLKSPNVPTSKKEFFT